MRNFKKRVRKTFYNHHIGEGEFKKWFKLLLFLICFSITLGYSQATIGWQKPLDTTATKVSVATKQSPEKSIKVVDAPNDPDLHKYLDSLYLFKASQIQMQFNPPQDVNRSVRRDHLVMIMQVLENDARIRSIYFKTLSVKPVSEDYIFYDDEESFRKGCPEESQLIDAYKKLSFAEPAESGLWGTPELSHASISPSSVYFGGIDLERSALNPIYMEPTKEIRYSGDYSDVEKFRSAPTIRVLKYFDVIETVNMNLGGGVSRYRWYPKNGPLRQISKELYPDCTPYNTRTLIPRF